LVTDQSNNICPLFPQDKIQVDKSHTLGALNWDYFTDEECRKNYFLLQLFLLALIISDLERESTTAGSFNNEKTKPKKVRAKGAGRKVQFKEVEIFILKKYWEAFNLGSSF